VLEGRAVLDRYSIAADHSGNEWKKLSENFAAPRDLGCSAMAHQDQQLVHEDRLPGGSSQHYARRRVCSASSR